MIKYFKHEIEYPNPIFSEILPDNILYSYISSTFLNGFINYIKPIKAYVIHRYLQPNEDISKNNVQYRDSNWIWHNFKGTKQELIDRVKSNSIEFYHTDLHCFDDDLIILGRNEEVSCQYIYFYFDSDVSDCEIGRFSTNDPIEKIGIEIEKRIINNENTFEELPVNFIKGWVHF